MRFYYGTDPILLHDKCLAEVSEFVTREPHMRAYIIVPERLKADTERRYLEKFEDSGLMMAEVLSFTRFAFRMLEMTGGLAIQRVNRSAKMMLIQFILRSRPKDFKQFSRYGIYSSFSREIDRVMGDFRRYDWSAEQLAEVADKLPDGRTKDKLDDFALLTGELDRLYAERNLTDQEEDLKRLIDKLERLRREPDPRDPLARVLSDSAVWISGFGDVRPLTPQEAHIARLLEELSAMLTMTLCLDEADGKVLYINGRESKRALGGLITPEKTLAVPDRRSRFPVYEKAFSGIPVRDDDAEIARDHLRLIEADDRVLQWRYIAGEIVRLHREDGYRWRDIAVALADTQSLALMRSVFAEYGLADFISVDQEPANTPLFFYLRSLLRLLGGTDSAAIFLEFVRTGLTEMTQEQCDALENYMVATGKTSLAKLRDALILYEAPDRGALLTDDVIEAFMSVWDIIDLVKTLTDGEPAGPFADSLLYHLDEGELGVRERLQNLIDAMSPKPELEGAALNLAKAWDLTVDQLSQIRQLLPEQKLGTDEFVDMLLAPFIGVRLQTIPIGVDRVRVAPLAGIYLYDSKITFIAGASAETFPGTPPNEGMLNNRERDAIMANSDGTLPQHRKTALTSLSFQAAQIMGAAADRVYLCAASTESDNLSAPQRLFRERLRGNTIHVDNRHPNIYLGWQEAARHAAANGPDDPRLAALRRAVAELRGEDPERYADGPAREDGDDPMDDAVPAIILSGELTAAALRRIRALSATGIARYHSCPYQFYVTDMLRLRERDVYLPDARNRGTMMHAIFEDTLNGLRRILRELPADASEDMLNEAVYRWHDQFDAASLEMLYRENAEVHRMLNYLEPEIAGRFGIPLLDRMTAALEVTADQFFYTRYQPAALEWRFPENPALTLFQNGIEMPITGIVDRVDINRETNEFRIIDYKTGDKTFSERDLLVGTDIQLPLYLQAWWSEHPEQWPEAVGFLSFRSKAGKMRDKFYNRQHEPVYPEDYIQYRVIRQDVTGLKAMAEYAVDKGREMLADAVTGVVSPRPAVIGNNSPCDWCEYKDLCRLDARRPQRQRVYDLPNAFDWNDIEPVAAAAKRKAYGRGEAQ